jgi:hypothetical protein
VGVVAGAHHDDRHVVVTAQLPDALETVDPREHEVDQHGVGRLAALPDEALLGGGGAGDGVSLVLECEDQRQADPVVVLDHQYGCHVPIIPAAWAGRPRYGHRPGVCHPTVTGPYGFRQAPAASWQSYALRLGCIRPTSPRAERRI